MSPGRIPRCPKCLRVLTRGDWRREEPVGVDVIWRFCPSHDPAGILSDEAATRAKARAGYGLVPAGEDVFKGFREGE